MKIKSLLLNALVMLLTMTTTELVAQIYPDDNNIIYVHSEANGNGSSWSLATSDLQAAIDAAASITPCATVWVASGTYYGDGIAANNAFTMVAGVNVYGGFAGNEAADYDLSLRDFETNATILDGQQVQRVLYQANEFTENTQATWDGFTIQNGKVNEGGGGVYLRAYYNLSHCKVVNNTVARNYGGGVYMTGLAVIENCEITNNTGFYGGGLYIKGTSTSTAIARNCMIENNTSTSYGGGVYAYGNTSGSIRITNCQINNNSGYYGGGVYAYYSDITNCQISNNSSRYEGGGVCASYSTFTNCDIVNNQCGSSYNGGGVYSEHSSNTFTNCIVWGNKRGTASNQIYGRAIFNYCAVEGGYEGTENINLSADNDGTGFLCPKFTNPTEGAGSAYSGGDWTLQDGSICINRGDTTGLTLPATDLAGNARIQQERIDIGAYESPYNTVELPEYDRIIPDFVAHISLKS